MEIMFPIIAYGNIRMNLSFFMGESRTLFQKVNVNSVALGTAVSTLIKPRSQQNALKTLLI